MERGRACTDWVDPGPGWYRNRCQAPELRSKLQIPYPGKTQTYPTPSCPGFCHPNVAKYDLNYSRRQTFVNSGPCSAFLRIMTSRSWGFGEKRCNRACSRLRCTRIPSGRSRVSREMLSDGITPDIPGREPGGFRPGPDQSGKYFLPAQDPAEKNPARPEFSGPGYFLLVTFGADKIFRLVRFCREKFRRDRGGPGKFFRPLDRIWRSIRPDFFVNRSGIMITCLPCRPHAAGRGLGGLGGPGTGGGGSRRESPEPRHCAVVVWKGRGEQAGCGENYRHGYRFCATISISTSAPFGRPAIWTVARAGNVPLKYDA